MTNKLHCKLKKLYFLPKHCFTFAITLYRSLTDVNDLILDKTELDYKHKTHNKHEIAQ